MIMMHVPLILVILLLAVSTLQLYVMTTMHAPRIPALLENALINQSQFLLPKILAQSLLATLIMVFTVTLWIAMITTHAQRTLVFLELANMMERTATTTMHVPPILAMLLPETASTLLWFVLTLTLAPKILAILLKDVSTLLSMI